MDSGRVFVSEMLNTATASITQKANTLWVAFPFYFPDLVFISHLYPIYCYLAIQSCIMCIQCPSDTAGLYWNKFPMATLEFQGVLDVQQYIITSSIRLAISALFLQQLAESALHFKHCSRDKLYKKNKKRSTYPKTARTLQIRLLWLQSLNILWFSYEIPKGICWRLPSPMHKFMLLLLPRIQALKGCQWNPGLWSLLRIFFPIKLQNHEQIALLW